MLNEELYVLKFIVTSPPVEHEPFEDPPGLLDVRISTIEGAGQGLFANERIPEHAIFAEYFGPVGKYNENNIGYAVRLTTPADPCNIKAQNITSPCPKCIDTVYGNKEVCKAAICNTKPCMAENNAMIVSSFDPKVIEAANLDDKILLTKRHAVHVDDPYAIFECERLFLVAICEINAGEEIFNFYGREFDTRSPT